MSDPESPSTGPSNGWSTRSRVPWIPLAWFAVFLLGLGLGWWLKVSRPIEPATQDHRVWSWVVSHRDAHPAWTTFFRAVTRLGDSTVAVTLVIGVGVGLHVLGRKRLGNLGRWDGLFFVGVMLGARLLVLALKGFFERERPEELHRLVVEGSTSFPSSHALNAAAFCVLMSILTLRAWPSRASWRWAIVAGLGAIASLIAASRVWLAVHYLSDVLVGLALGLLWSLAASALYFGWPGHPGTRDA